MRELYELSQKLLPHLKISNENIRYYASLVDYYSAYKLRRLGESVVYVYLLCFIQHRYQKLHDNLIQSLLHHVRKHSDEAKAAAKELVYNVKVATNADLQKAGKVLKLFTDDDVAGSVPFEEVRKKAFAVMNAAELEFVAQYLATRAGFDETGFQLAAPRQSRSEVQAHPPSHAYRLLYAESAVARAGNTIARTDQSHFIPARSGAEASAEAAPVRIMRNEVSQPDSSRAASNSLCRL